MDINSWPIDEKDQADITAMAEIFDIPEPQGLPWLGHITNVNPETPLLSFKAIADQYGECHPQSLRVMW